MRTEFTKTIDAVMPYCAALRQTIGDILTDTAVPAVEKREAISKAITGRFAEDVMRDLPNGAPLVPPRTPEPDPTPPAPKPEVTKAAPPAPTDRLAKIAHQARERDPKLTAEQCITKALEADPAAYDAIEHERQAQIRRLGALE